MSRPTAPSTPQAPQAPPVPSAECALAAQPGFSGLHAACCQTEDIPLPHSNGIVLVPRCGCRCHGQVVRAA